ncbi:MAG: hypothetical protein ACFCGT_09125, partial [Sandaracinaceae bacterium]
MTRIDLRLAAALLVLAVGCDGSNGDADMGTAGDRGLPSAPAGRDSDADFISDNVEGFPDRDSDGDLQPDWQDTDSDGDSIFDAIEAGDM